MKTYRGSALSKAAQKLGEYITGYRVTHTDICATKKSRLNQDKHYSHAFPCSFEVGLMAFQGG
uniref:Uncharacterized protein n=1 Tax=Anguilla anguilla TaxID=7936 RepID=A0A0E9SW48_ANGAN